MKILIIANPISGGGRGRFLASRLAGALGHRGHAAELFLTEAAGDAGRRAGELGGDVELLLTVGGDGTLNEVLNGLRDPSRVPLGQLPTGTANILAHELGLPRDPAAAARVVDAGTVRHIDMGHVGPRRFLMVVSAGFDAMVTLAVKRRRKGVLGYFGYPGPILSVLRRYRPPRLQVSVDGRDPVEGGLAIISNTRNYGGIFTVADRARCDSGHLDVVVLTRASRLPLMRMATRALAGGVSRMRGVTYLTGQRVSLEAPEPVPVQVDGDYLGTTPVEIELTPGGVPFLVPAERWPGDLAVIET